MLWPSSKYIYFWMQFVRVYGKAGKHCFYASTGTDSETIGRFTESITRVGYVTVYPGQTKEEAFDCYRQQVFEDAEQAGFTNNKIISISKRDYTAFMRDESRNAEEFLEQFCALPYQGKRMVRK